MRRVLLVGVVSVGMTLGLCAQALAVTTVSRSGNVITITGGDEVNYLDQPSTYGQVRYSDPAGINYGAGCTDAGSNTVDCGASGPGLVAQVNLGGGDDTFRPEAVYLDFPKLVVDLGAGNDTMWGSALDDTLNGGLGDDTINGRDGNDKIDGGEGRDRLSGADGDDTITGGPGVDSLFGDGEYTSLSGYGNDTLLARDGEADALSCSFGADSAVADANDTFDVLGDCEQRDIAGAAGPVAPGPNTPALTVGLGSPKPVKLGALLGGKALSFKITFSAACTATVGLVIRAAEARRLKIGKKETAIARAVDQVPQAGTYAATLKLKSTYRKKLRKARSVTAYLVLVCTSASGAQPATQRKLVFKR